jgi:hypothetical protein
MSNGKTLEELIQMLDAVPRIQQFVKNEWSTVHLDEYLLLLMTDTRDGERRGFDSSVAFAIMNLQLMNLKILQDSGKIAKDEGITEIRFTCGPEVWKLPKNF